MGKRLLVLVEGQTEETFVRDVLAAFLEPRNITPIPIILTTKIVKNGPNFQGGVTSTQQVVREVRRLLGDSNASAITTIIDYYGLPSTFPGMSTRPIADAYERVAHVEREFEETIGNQRFIPHLVLHEYETWVFSEPTQCAWVFDQEGVAECLEKTRDQLGGAELINENRDTCPSRRIQAACPGYQKTLQGPMAVEAIGLPTIREGCPHLDRWLHKLESL